MVTSIGDADLSTGNLLVVNSDGTINVGSIINTVPISGDISVSVGSLSVESVFVTSGNVYIASGDNLNLGTTWSGVGSTLVTNLYAGSNSFLFGKSGGTWMPLAVQSGTEAILRTTADVSVTTGSESWVKNFDELGSSRVITAGSIIITNQTEIGSLAIQTIDGTVSTNINNPETIGSYTGLYIGSENYIPAGSVIITNTPSVNQGTDPWIINGSVNVNNNITVVQDSTLRQITAGSVIVTDIPNVDINNPSTIGSYATQNIIGSVNIDNTITVQSTNLDIRDLTAATDSVTTGSESWIKNFDNLGSNRIITAGSVIVTNTITTNINNPSTIGSYSIQTINGSIVEQQTIPTDSSRNNPSFQYIYIISGTTAGVTGSRIGSIIQTIGAGSYIQTMTYSNNLITNVSVWS